MGKTSSAFDRKMVMFDTGDKTNVSVKNTLDLGNGYSEALYDPNAILIDYGKNLIGFRSEDGYVRYRRQNERVRKKYPRPRKRIFGGALRSERNFDRLWEKPHRLSIGRWLCSIPATKRTCP